MAQLLGSKFCIESLRNDVTDLQGVVVDVFSRTGAVRTQSWKYPDKTACDLDMTEILETYGYRNEEVEENQLAHIVLLELVIDRLFLLLQAMSKFIEQICSVGKSVCESLGIASVQGSSSSLNASTSIGLAVKKYWTKTLQLYTVLQKLNTELKRKHGRDSAAREIATISGRVTLFSPAFSDSTSTLNGSAIQDFSPNTKKQSQPIHCMSVSRDENNKSSQTLETAFMPCESCGAIQKCLRETSATVSRACTSRNLPCGVEKCMRQGEGKSWMSEQEIRRWCGEQNKDVERIATHLESLVKDEEKWRKELGVERSKMKELEKEIKLEKETISTQSRQFAMKLKEAQGKIEEGEKRREEMEKEMRREAERSKLESKKLREEIDGQRKNLEDYEKSLDVLKKKKVPTATLR